MTQEGPKSLKFTTLSTCRSAPSFSFGGRPVEKHRDIAPGPGKYGIPSRRETSSVAPSTRFGGGGRVATKVWDKPAIPGPGTYTAFDPNRTAPAVVFGSEARLPKARAPLGPDPCKYTKDSTLFSKGMTISSRFEARKSKSPWPEPGHYGIPRDDGIRTAPPSAAWSKMSEDRGKTDFTRSSVVSVDPGKYEPLKEMGGNVVTRIAPAYSFNSRPRPLKPDNHSVPGPSVPHYTQFG